MYMYLIFFGEVRIVFPISGLNERFQIKTVPDSKFNFKLGRFKIPN